MAGYLPYDDPKQLVERRERESRDGSETKSGGLAAKLRAGFGGAIALTALHEVARRLRDDAPRMDAVGARALARIFRALKLDVPQGNALYLATLTGDILSNGVFYAACLSNGSRRPRLRATLVGAAAGYAAYTLPPLLGLGHSPGSRHRTNRAMTVAWYATGGLVAAALYARRGRQARRRQAS